MSDQNDIQKVNGTWKGTPLSIKKVWGGHEFTADECAKLFNDEIIEFEATSKSGSTYKCKGKLERQTYTDDNGNDHEFVGFMRITDERFTGTWNGKEVSVKRVWSGHRFTDEEVEKLLAGEEITFKARSKTKNVDYDAKGKLADQEYEGKPFVGFIPNFSK